MPKPSPPHVTPSGAAASAVPSKARGIVAMCFFALAVGGVAGTGAWVFRRLIGFFHNLLFLGQFSFMYDANVHTPDNPWGAGIILVPILGALVVAWLVVTFAPEAKGHGVPEVMDAIYYNGGKIRPVVAVIKSVASALCIGSGGSVGREGPIIQIGSSFGATLADLVRLPAHQRVILIAGGAGGGIAATFNSPLGGVAFAIELLLVSVSAEAVLLVAIATATASYVGRYLLGTHPSFDLAALQIDNFALASPWLLLLFIPFGIVMGFVATAFTRGIYWTEDRFDAMPGNAYTRHVSGMLVVGILLYLFYHFSGHYYIEGVGYATIMDILRKELVNPWFLGLLFLMKYAATCLTLGSGGSGGVFSPALFMGATVGALFGNLCGTILPGVPPDSPMFVIAGMAAAIGGSTGAILTGSIMLMEMTADSNVVLPVIIATSFAYGVRKRLSNGSIYTLKLLRRGHVVPEGLQAAIVGAERARHVMSTEFQIVTPTATTVDDGQPIADAATTRSVVIVCDGQELLGVVAPHGNAPWNEVSTNAPTSHGNACILVQRNTPLIETMRAMNAAKVDYAVVTAKTSPRSPKAEIASPSPLQDSIVGVITPHEMAHFVRHNAEIF